MSKYPRTSLQVASVYMWWLRANGPATRNGNEEICEYAKEDTMQLTNKLKMQEEEDHALHNAWYDILFQL